MQGINLANSLIMVTDFNTNKNISSAVHTFTYPAIFLPSFGYTTQTFTFPSDEASQLYQVYIEYSLDPGKWHSFPAQAIQTPDIGVTSYLTNDGTTMSLYVFVASYSMVDITPPAFTINLAIRNFVSPF